METSLCGIIICGQVSKNTVRIGVLRQFRLVWISVWISNKLVFRACLFYGPKGTSGNIWKSQHSSVHASETNRVSAITSKILKQLWWNHIEKNDEKVCRVLELGSDAQSLGQNSKVSQVLNCAETSHKDINEKARHMQDLGCHTQGLCRCQGLKVKFCFYHYL